MGGWYAFANSDDADDCDSHAVGPVWAELRVCAECAVCALPPDHDRRRVCALPPDRAAPSHDVAAYSHRMRGAHGEGRFPPFLPIGIKAQPIPHRVPIECLDVWCR